MVDDILSTKRLIIKHGVVEDYVKIHEYNFNSILGKKSDIVFFIYFFIFINY